MNKEIEEVEASMKLVVLHPSLEEVVKVNGLNPAHLNVGLAIEVDPHDVEAREQVLIADGAKNAIWKVPSLRALFRGDKAPPSMSKGPPPAYLPLFFFIEQNVLLFCDALGDKTDGEFEEAYQQLRRRPDGTPRSHLQFVLWQVAACLAGKRPVSPAEFEAIFGRLARSASTFRKGLISRNYITVLRQTAR